METDQIISAIFLIAVLALILPGFLSTNNKLKQFFSNLSIWTIIVLVIIVVIYFFDNEKNQFSYFRMHGKNGSTAH